MPVWFRCKRCEEKYYTASSIKASKFSDECEKCGGNLQEIFRDSQKLIERGLMINFHLTDNHLSAVYEGKVLSVNNDEISLIVYSDRPNNLLKDLAACNLSFARDKSPEGRFYFHSRILGYYQHEDPQVVVEAPEFLIRREDRKAPRFELETTVKYRIAGDVGELMAMTDDDYKTGKTRDISKSGLLLVDYLDLSEINDKYIDLEIEYGDYRISTIGDIARVESVDETGDKKALGVRFLKHNSDNLDIIDELRAKKVAY